MYFYLDNRNRSAHQNFQSKWLRNLCFNKRVAESFVRLLVAARVFKVANHHVDVRSWKIETRLETAIDFNLGTWKKLFKGFSMKTFHEFLRIKRR